MKIGYHYTSKKNWENIQKEGGMKKYLIKKDEMLQYFPQGVEGVWLWKENPTGASHAGNILYQVSRKGTPEIVKLEVQYDPKKLVRYMGKGVDIYHQGHVDNWEYHKGERGLIVQENIPLQSIRVIGHYNTVQRLQ